MSRQIHPPWAHHPFHDIYFTGWAFKPVKQLQEEAEQHANLFPKYEETVERWYEMRNFFEDMMLFEYEWVNHPEKDLWRYPVKATLSQDATFKIEETVVLKS